MGAAVVGERACHQHAYGGREATDPRGSQDQSRGQEGGGDGTCSGDHDRGPHHAA